MFFADILRDLDSHGTRYLVIGGVAVNLHGFARATADLDLLLALDVENTSKFVSLLESRAWRRRPPVSLRDFADSEQRSAWIVQKGMKAFTVYNPAREIEQIDVLLEYGSDFEDLYRRREIVQSGDIRITLASVPDLITLKKQANRERDRLDLKALEKILELKRGKQGERGEQGPQA